MIKLRDPSPSALALRSGIASLRRRMQNNPLSHLADNAPTATDLAQRTMGNSRLTQAASRIQRAAHEEESASNLHVGPANDAFEREADQVAQTVVGSGGSHAASQSADIQRKEEGAGESGGAVSEDFANTLNSVRGGGTSLPEETLAQMNQGFGADFSNVRIHANSQSDQLNRSINARAFTTGSDIFFRPGEYNPHSEGGQQILAHELTHVVQQGGASQGVQRKMQIQRLISASAFKKDTKLSWGRKGKSKDFFATVVNMLDEYHTSIKAKGAQARIVFLDGILNFINPWLVNRGDKSSRRNDVVSLRSEIRDEIYAINQSLGDLKEGDFTDDNVTEAKDEAVGDSMSKLDELTYNFGVVEDQEGETKKETGGSFTGYFKGDVAKDAMYGRHRGSGAGIPENNPEFGKRNLAMLAIDKLLDAKVIPPTFAAQHNGKKGIVMKKIEGIVGRKAINEDKNKGDDQKRLNNPKVREGLSKLFLLDIICAQVDRHAGNYIIVMEDGEIKGIQGIDNDLAFGKDLTFDIMQQMAGFNKAFAPMIGPAASELKEIDRAFAQRIVALADDNKQLTDALKGLLSDAEIKATVDRLTALADFLRPMINNNDGILKTKWE